MMEEENLDSYVKLKRKHFRKYSKYSKFWADMFGLGDWEIRYFFMKATEGKDPRASTYVEDMNNRLISISLYDLWDIAPTKKNLMRTAFHEIVEVLLTDTLFMAVDRNDFSMGKYDREHHRVIRRLETFMEKIYDGTIDLRKIGNGKG